MSVTEIIVAELPFNKPGLLYFSLPLLLKELKRLGHKFFYRHGSVRTHRWQPATAQVWNIKRFFEFGAPSTHFKEATKHLLLDLSIFTIHGFAFVAV